MKTKNKITCWVLSVIACALTGYILWLFLRPVEIVAVHEDGNHSYVLVRHFPFTDRGKINWWLKNKDMLKSRFDIPKPASYGGYTVIFWDFGDGYKEEGKYDRFCFNDMKPPVNCIEKNRVFSVSYSRNRGIIFTTHYAIWQMKKNGRLVEIIYE